LTEPIVVIGMPRSGTTLVTEILDRLGVFMGVWQDVNREAVTFQGIDHWLLGSAGGGWTKPEPLGTAAEDPARRAQLSSAALSRLQGRRGVSYLGWPRLLRFGSIERQTGLWGWKAPRSTWTLPVWRELFPDLRVVHVVRHGVDVAASLREILAGSGTQAARRRAALPLSMFLWRGRRALRPVRRYWWVEPHDRLGSLAAALDLWTRYVDRGRAQVRELGDRAIELRFEDLADGAEAAVRSLGRLCGIDPTSRQLSAASGLVDPRLSDPGRTPELRKFAERHSGLLARYGY
jgi:hypothetical protein